MPNATLVKEIGTLIDGKFVTATGLLIVDAKAAHAYPSEFDGASAHFGASSDQIAIHLAGSPSLTAADAILAAIELPTCTAFALTVTVNVGTYLVNDATVITDVEGKFVKVSVAIDDTSGDLEVLVFEKATPEAEYGSVPAGKTLCADLKEYTVTSSALVLVTDFIDRI